MPAPETTVLRFRALPAAERRLALAAACRLTLVQTVLTRRGLLADGWSCVIGASTPPFAAHAWLERDGASIGPPSGGHAPVTVWRLPGGTRG